MIDTTKLLILKGSDAARSAKIGVAGESGAGADPTPDDSRPPSTPSGPTEEGEF